MLTMHRQRPVVRTAVAGVLAASAFGLAGCGDTAGPEEGATVEGIQEDVGEEAVDVPAVEDVGPGETAEPPGAGELANYDGMYDVGFHGDLQNYIGQDVTVSADVSEVVAPTAFVIAGTDDTTVEPMLVVSSQEVPDLAQDMTVRVDGTVRQAFSLVEVEQELGVDWDDALLQDWGGQPYIVADGVDTSVASDQ